MDDVQDGEIYLSVGDLVWWVVENRVRVGKVSKIEGEDCEITRKGVILSARISEQVRKVSRLRVLPPMVLAKAG